MRVSSDSDRQNTDLQRDALLTARRRSPTPVRGSRVRRHILLNGHYTFRSDGKIIDLDAIVAGLELG